MGRIQKTNRLFCPGRRPSTTIRHRPGRLRGPRGEAKTSKSRPGRIALLSCTDAQASSHERRGEPRTDQIAESLQARNEHLQDLLLRVGSGALFGLLLSGALAFGLGRRLVGVPVRDLISVARHVGSGDFTRRAADNRQDELGILAHEMNVMTRSLERARQLASEQEAARRQTEVQLQHADHLATVGQLASGVAHDIGTPLQSIAMRAELIHELAEREPDMQKHALAIKRQTGQVATIVRNLLRFARKQPVKKAPGDLREAVDSAVALAETAKTKSPVEIVTRVDSGLPLVDVDAGQIEQMLTNLILNAIQAMPNGGQVTVGLEPARAEPPDELEQSAAAYVCVYVEDQGTGIDEDVLPHLFDPFFTTKDADNGTGLGLSICYGIVREHGGWIDVQTSRGVVTRFSVYLPIAASSGRSSASSDGPRPPLEHHARG